MVTKIFKRKDGNPSKSLKKKNATEKHVTKSLKSVNEHRFKVISNQIHDILTTITNLDRKIDGIQSEISSSMRYFLCKNFI